MAQINIINEECSGFMKNILILSVTAGDGHNAIGKALLEELQQLGYKVHFIDIIKQYSTKTAFKRIDKGYLFVCQHFVGLYNLIYKRLCKLNPKYWHKVTGQKIVKNVTPKIYQEIMQFKPQAVICTHVYASIAMSNLHRSFDLPCKTFGILTDYMVHPFWEAATKINFLLLPSSQTISEALKKGFTKQQLIVTGLPVSKKFLEQVTQEQARERLNLQQNAFTLLIIFSKACFKNIKKMITEILNTHSSLQLIVVNGKNKKYKNIVDKLITKNGYKNVLNLGYISYMHTCISASDLVISKAGAATVNETLNKGVPLLVYCKVAQQEIANINYLVQHNASIKVKNLHHLCETIKKCITHPTNLKTLKANIARIRKPNACTDIVTLIKNMKPVDINSYHKPTLLSVKEIKKHINKTIKKDSKTTKK